MKRFVTFVVAAFALAIVALVPGVASAGHGGGGMAVMVAAVHGGGGGWWRRLCRRLSMAGRLLCGYRGGYRGPRYGGGYGRGYRG